MAGDEKQYAVLVERADGTSTRIGPLPFHHQAEHMTWAFDSMKTNTTGADGATNTVVDYDPELPHLPPLPQDADLLADLLDDPEQGVGDEIPFPDAWSRLHAQLGYVKAVDLWSSACGLYDLRHSDDTEED